MKHPALARVFAIVLALLSSFMLINGALGFSKADGTLQESLEYCQRVEDKLNEYEELDAKLENSISYDEAYEELERLQEEHDEEAAQHRTDLATHTATMGGYTMGVDMITDGKAQLDAAKQELESGKQQLAQQETLLNQSVAAFEENKDMLTAGISQIQALTAPLQDSADKIPGMIAQLNNVPEKPQHPGEAPTEPTAPTAPTEPVAPGENATEEEKAEYNKKLEEYNALKAQYDLDKAAYDELKKQYDQEKAAYDEKLSEYNQKYADWKVQADSAIEAVNKEIADSSSGVNTAVMGLNMALKQIEATAPELVVGIGSASVNIPEFEADTDLETVKTALEQYKQELLAAVQIPTAMQTNVTAMESQLQQGQAALEAAKRKIVSGEEALKKGENELQHQLELLWYNMGQLEDEAEELEENKEKLDAEADKLDKMLVSVDELKELEDGRRSARIILMQESEIEAMVNDGGDLGDSTRSFLEQRRSEAEYDHRMLYLINAFAAAGGLLGILCIPGSYELVKKRLLLIAPPLLCLLCAAAAWGLNLYQGLGQMYTALFAGIGALLHLLIVVPKNKTPVAAEGPFADEQAASSE